jgi:putative ABC transport system permease protein
VSILDVLGTSTTAMRTNLLRTFLSMLGIIIAIAAVIGLTAATEGKKEGIADRIRGLGSDLLIVRPGATENRGVASLPGLGPSLFYEDAQAIGDARLPYVDGMASLTGAGGGQGFASVAQVIYRGQNASTVLIGTEPSYQVVRDHYVTEGRFLSEDDVTKKGLVVVLGANIAEKLFGTEDPVGKPVRVFAGVNERFGVSFSFTVIGVMERKGAGGTGDEDDRVFTPLPSFQSRIPFLRNAQGFTNVSQINIKLDDRGKADQAKQDIAVILRDRHESATDDFTIETQSEVLSTATEVEESLRTLVVSVASIALVVGGLGIVNIMLVSVTERTREIGIRKAIGARRTDILMQFLVEAVLITLIGGTLGVLIGWGVTRGLEHEMSFDLPSLLVWDPPRYEGGENYVVTPLWIFVGLAVSAVTGLVAGVYPAWRASRLDPIEALRHE